MLRPDNAEAVVVHVVQTVSQRSDISIDTDLLQAGLNKLTFKRAIDRLAQEFRVTSADLMHLDFPSMDGPAPFGCTTPRDLFHLFFPE